jgi:WhiB family redox-sensing transcriptional regulator
MMDINDANAIEWLEFRNCAGMDTNLFYTERGSNNAIVEARRICNGCIVKNDCLQYALTNNELYGIWGGMTSTERKHYKRIWIKNNRKVS